MIVLNTEQLARHFDVTVYCAASVPPEFVTNGYRAFSPPLKWKRLAWRWLYLALLFFKHHVTQPFDALYAFWGYPAGTVIVALGKLVRRPSVVTILGAETADIPTIQYGYLRKETRRLMLWTLKHATKLIAVSAYQVKNMEAKGLYREAHVVPWGVDTTAFYRVERQRGVPLRILHVSNLNIVKDQETLIRAFVLIRAQIPAKLRIVGPDYLDGRIQALAAAMHVKDDVEFAGAVPHAEIAREYQAADIFVLTSLSEGQNMSLHEAMTCGVLSASTAVGMMHDLGPEYGIVFAPGDYHALATQLIALYGDEYEWNRRRMNAHRWANQHTLSWTVGQLVELINETCDKQNFHR